MAEQTTTQASPVVQLDSFDLDDRCYFWNDSYYLDGTCFKLFAPPSETLSWHDARTACTHAAIGARLVETIKASYLTAVRHIISRLTGMVKGVWLGISDIEHEGTFQLQIYGDSIRLVNVWDTNQPDDVNATQNCLAIAPESGLVRDDPCFFKHSYICQVKVSNPCDLIVPGGYYQSGKCYTFNDTFVLWKEGQQDCIASGAIMAEPATPEEGDFLAILGADYSFARKWLGGFANSEEGQFVWYSSNKAVPIIPSMWAKLEGWTKWDGHTPMYLTLNANQNRFVFKEESIKSAFYCQHEIGNPCEKRYSKSFYVRGVCLKPHLTPLSWVDSQAACQEESATLVEFNDDVEIARAAILLSTTLAPSDDVIIGLSYNQTEGAFKWATTGVAQNLTEWWDMGEPSNMTQNQDYGAIGQNGKLKAIASSSKHPFVCMKQVIREAEMKHVLAAPSPKLFPLALNASLRVTTLYKSRNVHFSVMVKTGISSSDYQTIRSFVTKGESTTIALDDEYFAEKSGVVPYYIEVSSPLPVTVVLIYTGSVGSDGFLVPPIQQSQVTTPSTFFLPCLDLTSLSNSLQIVIASTSDKDTSVLIRIPSAFTGMGILKTGGIEIAFFGDLNCKLSARESLLLNFDNDFINGTFVWTSSNVLLTLAALVPNQDGASWVDDYIMSYVPSTSYASKTYITFPSLNHAGVLYELKDVYLMTAIYDSTEVVIHGLDGVDITNITLSRTGDCATIGPIIDPKFHLIEADKPFYLAKKSVLVYNGNKKQCLTYISPKEHWRTDYQFNIPPHVDNVVVYYIFLIVDASSVDSVTVNDQRHALTCQNITGETEFKGCYYAAKHEVTTPQDTSAHTLANARSETAFGAYMAMVSSQGYLCHSLGVPRIMNTFSTPLNKDEVYRWLVSPTTKSTHTTISFSGTTAGTREITIPFMNLTNSPGGEISTTDDPSMTTFTVANSGTYASTNDIHLQTDTTTVTSTATGKRITIHPPQNEAIKRILRELDVDVRSTSAFKRTKSSASDKRVSSAAIGALGITIMCLVFGLFVMSDVVTACSKIVQLLRGHCLHKLIQSK